MSGIACLIVAAGRGKRIGGSVPKQYTIFKEKPLITHSVDVFKRHPLVEMIRVVIHPDDETYYNDCVNSEGMLPPIYGGINRQESVKLGLNSLVPFEPRAVLIHDAARPCVDMDIISNLIEALKKYNAVIPALPIVDTLKQFSNSGILNTCDRTKFWRAQTPQAFYFREILDAHNSSKDEDSNDDAQVAELAGLKVRIIPGNEKNKKITYLEDLPSDAINTQKQETRVGFGFDVHKFEDGDSLYLFGVNIPFEMSLKGHSDADVGLHALTDALLGSVGAGDIGEHFPPSDDRWRNKSSSEFLIYSHMLIKEQRGTIVNIDVTLICEAPIISPYKPKMRNKIAQILGISEKCINIKGTTTEQLGFLGRKEGISASAVVSVRFLLD